MTIEKYKEFTKIIPGEGMFLALKDLSQIYDGEIYLSQLDSSDNYIEVNEEAAEKIRDFISQKEI